MEKLISSNVSWTPAEKWLLHNLKESNPSVTFRVARDFSTIFVDTLLEHLRLPDHFFWKEDDGSVLSNGKPLNEQPINVLVVPV